MKFAVCVYNNESESNSGILKILIQSKVIVKMNFSVPIFSPYFHFGPHFFIFQ